MKTFKMNELSEFVRKTMPFVRNSTWLFRKVISADEVGGPMRACPEDVRNCNRLWDKVQHGVIASLCELRDSMLPIELKNFEELCLRRILDGIAFQIFGCRQHIVNRLNIHGSPQRIDFTILRRTINEADRLNTESRLSFALISDLTTFIHNCDLVRLDWRKPKGETISIIELKSGMVNDMLMPVVDSLPAETESLQLDTKGIAEPHQKQFRRMVKQRIRRHQTEKILRTDHKNDVVTDITQPLEDERKIQLVSCVDIELQQYDSLVNLLCAESISTGGIFCSTYQDCLHIGVAVGESYGEAHEGALDAALECRQRHLARECSESASNRCLINELIGEDESYTIVPLFDMNIKGGTTTPFTLWSLDNRTIENMMARRLEVMILFDLPAFIHLAREFGIEMLLSSRKEGEKYANSHCPKWDRRVLIIKENGMRSVFGAGALKRIVGSLDSPKSVLMLTRVSGERLVIKGQN